MSSNPYVMRFSHIKNFKSTLRSVEATREILRMLETNHPDVELSEQEVVEMTLLIDEAIVRET